MPHAVNSTNENPSEPDRGNWSQAWRMFTAALPLFCFWLLIPLVVGLLILSLNAVQPLARGVYSPPLATSFLVGEWEVRLSYPREVTTDPSLLSHQAVSMQASGPVNAPPGEVMIEVWTSDGHLSLVDEQGRPLPQPFRQVLSTDPTALPVRIYLLAGTSAPDLVALTFRATSPPNASQASHSVPVSVEPAWQTVLFGLISQGAGTAVWGGALLSAMVGFAVQQWNRMREEQREEEQQRRDALAEVEGLRELLQQRDYERALMRYQALKRRNFFPWTEQAIQESIQDLWDQEAPEELRRWARLCALQVESQHSPSVNLCEEGALAAHDKEDLEADIKALLWAYRFLPTASGSVARVLKGQLEKKPEALFLVEKVLADDVDGRALLRSPELAQVFREMESKKDTPQAVECARRLQTLHRSPSPWLNLWPRDRMLDPSVDRGVRALGLKCNPFGPERAEMDPLLGEYGYRPPVLWEYLSNPQPIVVLGGPGSGKTATALLLAYDCRSPSGRPRKEGTLPVYFLPYESPLPSSGEASCRYLLDQIARSVAEALLQVIAKHPYLFTEQHPAGQAAVASLWVACLGKGSVENLGPHLLRAGLREEGAGRKVWQEVRKLAGAAIVLDEMALLELLGEARPAGFQQTEILMDWGAEPDAARSAAIARSMEAFLRVVPALAARGVYVKTFLPRACRPSPEMGHGVPMIELSWTGKDLREILRCRLNYAGIEELRKVYLVDPAALHPDPDEYLVQQAKGCPRTLIRLGNRMLSRVETAPLRPEHLL
jgi:hypothetical protein